MKKTIYSMGLLIVSGYMCAIAHAQNVVGGDIDAKYSSFLKHAGVKTTNESQRQKLFTTFEQRELLADKIAASGEINLEKVQVLLREYEKDLLINAYLKQQKSEKANGQLVEQYYEKNIKEFTVSRIRVAHIYFSNSKSVDIKGSGKQLNSSQRAKQAYDEIVNANELFEVVASRYSEDKTTALKGGDLGWVKKDYIDNKFSKVAFSTAVGSVSKPFKSSQGIHIIKVLEAVKSEILPLDEVRYSIKQKLTEKVDREAIENLLEAKQLK